MRNKRSKRISWVRWGLFMLTHSCFSLLYAQSRKLPVPDVLTEQQGLPQAFVPAIVQDQRGFIWLATLDGLCRFDGQQINVWQPTTQGRPSLSNAGVISIKPAQQGQLWVAGQRSIDLVDPVRQTFAHFSKQPFYRPFAEYRINDIYPDHQHRLWLLFTNQGIASIDLQTHRVISYRSEGRSPSTLASNQVRSILDDRRGTVWLATARGLQRLDAHTNRFTRYAQRGHSGVLAEDDLYGLHQRVNGHLLIVSRKYVMVLNPQTGQLRTFPLPQWVALQDVVRIATDSQGNDYIAYHDQVLRFNEQAGIQPLVFQPESWRSQSLLIDRSDVLWIGTTGAGVRIYNLQSTRFDTYPYTTNFYLDLLAHEFKVPRQQLRSLPTTASAYDFRYTLDRHQKLWFTLGTPFLYQLDLLTRRLTTSPLPAPLRPIDQRYPIALATDPQGQVWAIRDSVAMWQDAVTKRWQLFSHPVRPMVSRLNDKTTIFQAVIDDQALWLSTGSQGLYRVDRLTGRIRQFRHQPRDTTSLSTNTLFYLSGDPADPSTLWIGTFGGGVCRFDKRTGRCQRITQLNGLPNNVIYATIPDRSGSLWIATNQGVCRMDRRASKNRSMQTYNQRDGLLANEFNRFHVVHLPTDRIILGGLEGITAFDPAQLRKDTYQPAVELIDIQINNRPLSAAGRDSLPVQLLDTLDLDYRQNFLSVAFAALQFNNPAKLRYRYQLEGIDNQWVVASQPRAVYTNLSPGTYTLRLNTSNTSGIWSPHVRLLTVVIHPPWWKTWWAYLLYVATSLAVAGTLVRSYWQQQQAQQLKAVNELKTRFFSNITHEFRTPLTLILAPAQQLARNLQDPDDRRRLAIIDRNAHQLLQLVNQLLDLSKLDAGAMPVDESRGDLVQFIREIYQSFTAEAETKNIRFVYKPAELTTDYYFDAPKLERMLYNLIANALKFTPAGGHITIELTPAVTITVSDTGVGIPADQLPHIFDRFYQVDKASIGQPAGTGLGLTLVKELVERQNGTIRIRSEVGRGTTVSLALPYRPAPASPSVPVVAPARLSPEVADRSTESPVVLLVEDNDELAGFITESLPTSYQICRASQGADGLEQAIRLMPDLIISDVLMPIMDGYTFSQTIKADPRTSHIPLILLTAKSSHDSRLTGLRAGADEYLTKPFQIQELQLRVQNQLAQRHRLREWIRASLTQLPTANQAPSAATANPFLTSLYAVLEDHLDDASFGADELIAASHLSRMSLHRKLKALTSMPVGEFIRAYRLRRATDFLSQGYTSSETAYRVGFDSPAYFSKCFREAYQLTPTEFAAQINPANRQQME
ncbi:hybrid sensor histidine kinase/response regulator transcription factor [Spirosoma aerolatum]|uniref:hybrid sensor histidine kinase/response regulator transcription factor n=1 Tax=Spirosoma aerolatum TaxID=1211326 RepID=UPI0009AC1B11|nr:ATP-binding protein [Spirosoma aerolatum]